MSALNIFVPLTKVDVENRLVYGTVAEEILDNSGEMFDYAKSKPYFQKWSANAELTSGGLSKGNVRAMHGKVAAGKLTDLGFDDEARRIECCAKVVDDNEWKKCLEGVYTGFSMGGRYAEKWVEKSDNGMDIKRYAGDPAEISLVDKPCIPTATFQLVKADGVVENHHFTSVLPDEALDKTDAGGDFMKIEFVPTNDQLAERSTALAKAAGKPETAWMEFMDAARDELVAEHLAKADTAKEGEEDKGDFDEDAETGPKEDGSDDDTKPSDEKEDDKDKKDGKGKPFGKSDGEGGTDGDEAADQDAEAAEKGDIDDWDKAAQVWQAKDGSTHVKKADALARNAELKKAAEAEAKPSLLDALGSLKKSVEAVKNGEADDEGGQDGQIEKSDADRYAGFFEGVSVLLKSDDSGQDLNKSMYTVERMARVLRDAASLQMSVSREQKAEGDDSETPGMIGVAVGQLGEALIAMAKEEVDELLMQVANNASGNEMHTVADCYYELAASTLGLEKSDVDELLKAAVSKKSEYVQKSHDHMVKMGASCAGMEKADADAMAKVDGELSELRKRAEDAEKQVADAMPLIKSLQADVEMIKKMPLPAAPKTSVVEKADDGKQVAEVRAQTTDDLLGKFTPDQLADAAIRMAQGHGVTMTARGSLPTR